MTRKDQLIKLHMKQHGIIQDLSTMLEKSGFLIESYQNSIRVKHNFFDFAIFIHKGWLKFSDIFRTKLSYDKLSKFVSRMVSYIYKKFKLDLTKKLEKFKQIAEDFLKENNITEIKNEEKLSPSEQRRIEMHKDLDKKFEEHFNYKYNPKNLEYGQKIIGDTIYVKLTGLLQIKITKSSWHMYRLSTLPLNIAKELSYKLLNLLGLDKNKIKEGFHLTRGHSYLINKITM